MGQRDKTGAVVKCRVSKITIPWAWGRWTGDGNGGQRVAFPLMLQRSRWCLPWAEGVMPGASETSLQAQLGVGPGGTSWGRWWDVAAGRSFASPVSLQPPGSSGGDSSVTGAFLLGNYPGLCFRKCSEY